MGYICTLMQDIELTLKFNMTLPGMAYRLIQNTPNLTVSPLLPA
jgi:hypothetical protein